MKRRGALLVLVLAVSGLLGHPGVADGHEEVAVGPPDTRRHSPSVAVDTADPNKVVISTYDSDRTAIRLFVSRDGGRSFTEIPAPKAYGWRRFQPEVLLVDGRLYLAYAAFDDDEAGIVLVRSEDLGATWGRPRFALRTIMETADACLYPSSPSLAIEPSRPSAVLAAWESWDYLNGCKEEIVRTFVARSDDAGETFGQAVEIPLPGRMPGDWVYYPQLVALPDGGLAVGAEVDRTSSDRSCPSATPQDVVISISNDGGRSFRSQILTETCGPSRTWQATPVGFLNANPTGGTHYPGPRVKLAANRRTGRLTAVWLAGSAAGISRMSTAHSVDAGRTWQDAGAPSEPEVNQQQFPSLAIGPDGSAVVLYFAQMPGGVIEPRMSTAGPESGWSAPVALAARPAVGHDWRLGGAYFTIATFFGNLTSLAVGADGIAHPVWVDLRDPRLGPAKAPYQMLTRRVGVRS